ncbi:hypothetical protein V8F33_010710 [Rhypophila sp. PSN 637]
MSLTPDSTWVPTTTTTATTTTASSTSSPTPTEALVGFTTPFPRPASCAPLLTTTVSLFSAGVAISSVTFPLPDESSPYYTNCVDPDPASHFSFSPAVCPEGWAGGWMGVTAAATASDYISTAYCCAPGYSIHYLGVGDHPSVSCEQRFVTTTSRSGDGIVRTEILSVARMPAWYISWQTTDVPTLSPQPPDLGGGDRVSRWVPGSDPEFVPVDNWGVGLCGSLYIFLVVGIPVIIVGGIAAWICCCCRTRYPVPTCKISKNTR